MIFNFANREDPYFLASWSLTVQEIFQDSKELKLN